MNALVTVDNPIELCGVQVDPGMSPSEMLSAAGLDWEVRKNTLSYEFKGKRMKSRQMALIRTDDGTELTRVGPDWNPVQNADAFDFFNRWVEAGNMTMHAAGVCDQSRMVWALAKLDASFELGNGDVTDAFLLFSNPHKYGKTIDVRLTSQRMACNNMLGMALKTGTEFLSINHRTPFEVGEVQDIIDDSRTAINDLRDASQFLFDRRYTDETLYEFARLVFPINSKRPESKDKVSKNAKSVIELVEKQPGAEYSPGSWWNAFNAVTYVVDHKLGRSDDKRWTSATYGSGFRTKRNALTIATEMANAA